MTNQPPPPAAIASAFGAESPREMAVRFVAFGVAVLPLKATGTPAIKQWQKHPITTHRQLDRWWPEDGYQHGVGWIPSSCGLQVLDIDVKRGLDGFSTAAEVYGIDGMEFPHRIITPSGGAHLIYLDTTPPGYEVKRDTPNPNKPSDHPSLDVIGTRGFCAAWRDGAAYVAHIDPSTAWAPMPQWFPQKTLANPSGRRSSQAGFTASAHGKGTTAIERAAARSIWKAVYGTGGPLPGRDMAARQELAGLAAKQMAQQPKRLAGLYAALRAQYENYRAQHGGCPDDALRDLDSLFGGSMDYHAARATEGGQQ